MRVKLLFLFPKLSWLAIALLGLTACNLGEGTPSWQTDVIAPVAQGRLEILSSLADSLVETGGDNLLRVVYRDTLSTGFLSNTVELPDTNVSLSFALDTLTLDSDTITERRTLREVATELSTSSDPQNQILGLLLLSSNGNTLYNLPPIDDFGLGTIPVDASDFFNFAELKAGTLTLEIVNEFPVGIDSLVFAVRNANLPGPPLLQDTFTNIPPRSRRTESYDLAGKSVESSLVAELTQASLDSTDSLLVNLDDYIELRLIAEGMQASSAEAVFPDQDLIDTVRRTVYQLGEGLEEIQITKLKVRSGRIEAEARSTVQDSILFEYRLDGATNGRGETPVVALKMPPAPPGGIAERNEIFDLEGFTLDLSDQGTTWNTLRERILVKLLSSGQIVTLSDQDSVEVFFGLLDLSPVYIEGYLGQQEILVQGAEAIELFDGFNVDRVRLSEAQASIVIGNSVGVPAAIEVRDFTAHNQRNGAQVGLASDLLVLGPLELKHPFLPDTQARVETPLLFSPDNSNVTRWLSTLPDSISYDLRVQTNPEGFKGQRDNFATDSSSLDAYIDFELPLSGVVDRFRLRDTLEINWDPLSLPDEVGAGTVYLLLDNEFPIEVKLSAQLFTEDFEPITDFAKDFTLAAAIPEPGGRTQDAQRSILEKSLSPNDAETWTQEGRWLIIDLEVDTRPVGESVKIYADYGVEAKLTAQFELGVN